MIPALHRFCFALWAVGLAGMGTTKGMPAIGDLAFAVAARLSVVGLLSLCFLLALELAARERRAS